MKKHVVIVGNLASGKTRLTKILCKKNQYIPYLEEPERRPFQTEFASNLERWSFANQIDFLTFKAQQELEIGYTNSVCVQDGSLDQDMFVFSQHLVNKGILREMEFKLCEQVYKMYRNFLPPPSVIVRTIAPIPILLERRNKRARSTDESIIASGELSELEQLMNTWIDRISGVPIINFNTKHYDSSDIENLIVEIEKHLVS